MKNKYDLWTAITAVTILVLAATGLGVIGCRELMADENFRAIALFGLAAIAHALIFVGAIVEMMAKDSPARTTPPEGDSPRVVFLFQR